MTCFASLDLGDLVIFSCGLLNKGLPYVCTVFNHFYLFDFDHYLGVGGAILRRISLAFLEIEKNTCLHIT